MRAPSFASFRSRVLRDALAAAVAGVAVLQAMLGTAPALGFALGAGVATVVLFAQTRALGGGDRAPAPAAARLGSLGRSGARAAALTVAFVRPELSFGWAAAGLLLGPAVVIARGASWRLSPGKTST